MFPGSAFLWGEVLVGCDGPGGHGLSSDERAALMLAETRAEVAVADHKASMVFAASGIGLSAVLGGVLAGSWQPSSLTGVWELVWWVGAVLAVTAVASSALAVWPRYRTSDPAVGFYYWGDVARCGSCDAFVDAFREESASQTDRTLRQLWTLSRIVDRKYFYVRAAFVLLAASAPLFLLAGLAG